MTRRQQAAKVHRETGRPGRAGGGAYGARESSGAVREQGYDDRLVGSWA